MSNLKIASIKLVSGEEVICTLLDITKDGPYTIVTIKDPVKVEQRDRRKKQSYSMSNWLMFHNEGIHDIEVSKIITVNEITDEHILEKYYTYFRKKLVAPKPRASKKIGFLGNINDYKKTLEKLYTETDSYEKPTEDI